MGLGLGFPIVVVLAWIFDVNAGRIERTTPGVVRGRVAAVALAGVSVLAAAPGLAWYVYSRPRTSLPAPAPGSLDLAPSIAVLPLVNLTRAVVSALKVKLLAPPASMERRTTVPEAFDHYLLGTHAFHRNSVEGFKAAKDAYQKAVSLDPGYAPAWAGLALATYWVSDSSDTVAAVKAGQDRAVTAASTGWSGRATNATAGSCSPKSILCCKGCGTIRKGPWRPPSGARPAPTATSPIAS